MSSVNSNGEYQVYCSRMHCNGSTSGLMCGSRGKIRLKSHTCTEVIRWLSTSIQPSRAIILCVWYSKTLRRDSGHSKVGQSLYRSLHRKKILVTSIDVDFSIIKHRNCLLSTLHSKLSTH